MRIITKFCVLAFLVASTSIVKAQTVITEIGTNISSLEELEGTQVALYNPGRGLYVYNAPSRYEMGNSPEMFTEGNIVYAWTFEKTEGGKYQVKDSNGKYVPVLGRGATMTGSVTGDDFTVTSSDGKWLIQGSDGNYFNGNGLNQGFVGWSEAGGNSLYEIRPVKTADLAELTIYTMIVKDTLGNELQRKTISAQPNVAIQLPEFAFRKPKSATFGDTKLEVKDNTVTIPENVMGDFVVVYADNLPFLTTTIENGLFAANTAWYQLSLHNTNNRAYLKYNAETQLVDPIKSDALNFYDDTQLWCFVGSVTEGVKVYNKAAGTNISMTYVQGENNVSLSTGSIWTLTKVNSQTAGFENAFCLKNSAGTYINYNAYANKVEYYGGNDDGSGINVYSFKDYVAAKLTDMNGYTNLPDGTVGTPRSGYGPVKEAIAAFEENPCQETEEEVYRLLRTDLIEFTSNYYYRIFTKGRAKNPYLTVGQKIKGAELDMSDASLVWRFVPDGEYYNLYSQGLYLTRPAQSVQVGTTDDQSGAQMFSVDERSAYARFGLRPVLAESSEEFDLHLDAQSNVVGWNGGDASDWYLVRATTIEVTVPECGYTTMNFAFPVQLPVGLVAYVGTANAVDGIVMLKEIARGVDGIVPANTPVVLCGDPAKYTLGIFADNESEAVRSDLRGTLLSETLADDVIAYVWSQPEGEDPGFYLMGSDKRAVNKNQAYLVSTDASLNVYLPEFEGATAIEKVEFDGQDPDKVYFDLQGRRVVNPTKGIYVTANGKKVLFY